MNIRFDNQIVLITGGSRGIGKQLAQDFESLGAKVFITGTKDVAPDFTSQGNYRYFSVDFSNPDSSNCFLEELKSLSDISILINNAGINKINSIEDVLSEDYDDILKVNLEIPFRILQIISSHMKKNKYGKIINISSIFGKISRKKRVVYSMSKFGIHGLTVSSSIELAEHGVLVNTVSPGFTLTDLTRKNLKAEEMLVLNNEIPIGRMAEVSEISSIILFMTSRFNTYITGQNVFVDGGYTNV